MIFDTEFKKENDYFYMKYKGNDSKSVINSLDDVFQNCKTMKQSKLIIDLRDFNFNEVTDMTRFYFGEKIANLSNDIYRVKVGVILNKKDYDGIGEITAQNRGAFAKAFFNKEDTLKWLLK